MKKVENIETLEGERVIMCNILVFRTQNKGKTSYTDIV